MTMRRFRKWCRTFHRELGYLAVGLTLVYAVSGIVVNHAHHWDANYERTAAVLSIAPPGTGATEEIEPLVLQRLALDRPVKNTWRAGPELLQVFLEGEGYDVNLVTGEVVHHAFRKRPLLFDLNFMHLNSGKGPWTGIADAYAGILVVMAVTGPWLVRGRKGLKGRGGLLMGLGIMLPFVYAFLVRGGG
jgi:hypothetical protein